MTRRGGIYAWRVMKPWSLFGVPLLGRRWGYVGMTNSYRARENQHLYGSTDYGVAPASWSDLKPRCYRILPLPALITHGKYRRRIMKAFETLAIWTLLPVYNEKQQAPWNLRRCSRKRAARDRANRDTYGLGLRLTRFVLRMCFWAIALGVCYVLYR